MKIFKLLKPQYAGRLIVNEGETIDITDPCYDKPFRGCGIGDVKVKSGEYVCNVYVDTDGVVGGLGKTPCANEIILPEYEDEGEWNFLCYIGVDAGLAGCFINKPNFNDQEWEKVCDYTYNNKNFANKIYGAILINDLSLIKCRGFYTQSGYGDGTYPVWIKSYNDKIVGIRISFV